MDYEEDEELLSGEKGRHREEKGEGEEKEEKITGNMKPEKNEKRVKDNE